MLGFVSGMVFGLVVVVGGRVSGGFSGGRGGVVFMGQEALVTFGWFWCLEPEVIE